MSKPRTSSYYKRYRAQVQRSRPPCFHCGKPATTVDHYPVRVRDGGTDAPDNLVPACTSCNYGDGARATNRARARGRARARRTPRRWSTYSKAPRAAVNDGPELGDAWRR